MFLSKLTVEPISQRRVEEHLDQDGKVCHPVNRVRRLTVLRPLDHPYHVAKAFGALTRQQQVATLDGAAEIDNRRFVAAGAAPDAAGLAPAGVRPCWAHKKRARRLSEPLVMVAEYGIEPAFASGAKW